MPSLHVICGLTPQIKNPGCAYVFMCVHVIYMRSYFYLHLFRHLTYCIIEKNCIKNELILKGIQVENFLLDFRSKNLTDL